MANSIDQFKSLVSQKQGIARPNVFKVELPSLPGATSEEVNLLCKDVQLPGRQIMTNDRTIGLKTEKVAYGYLKEDVYMTFLVLNDYGIRNYFEQWQKLAVDQETYEVGYFTEYSKQVKIYQLKKGFSVPVYSTPLGLPRLPTIIQNRLPRIGPFDLAQGQLDLDFITSNDVLYECTLIDAFPSTLNLIQLNNELDGLVELTVGLSYTDWRGSAKQVRSDLGSTLAGTILSNLIN
jgi:hypothetical protein